jgi:flavin reductase (DIM6/NTAB) family NADH-FMN oxidoreductase RutF
MCVLLEQSGRYGVSVLSDQQRHLSSHFAGRPQPTPIPFREVAGVPVIEGALTQLVAKVINVIPAGDHRLFLGEVSFLDYETGSPLIFHSGDFRALAHPAEFTARWEHVSDWV